MKATRRQAIAAAAALIREGRADVALQLLRSDLRRHAAGREMACAIADLIEQLTAPPKGRRKLSAPLAAQMQRTLEDQARTLVKRLQRGPVRAQRGTLSEELQRVSQAPAPRARAQRNYPEAVSEGAKLLGLTLGQMKHTLNPPRKKPR